MKKIKEHKANWLKHIGVMVLLMISASSCKEYLEVEPYSDWNADEFYSNEDEIEIALAGIYSILASDEVYGQAMTIIMESGTDEGYYNRRYNENWTVGLYRHTAADNYVAGLWKTLYSCINQVNLFEEKMDRSAFEEEVANQYLAEVRFLRALAYANLTNWYGEVPLKLTPVTDQSDNDQAVATLGELYAQIIADYTFATEHLLRASDPNYIPGRANKAAAHGLLARVYLKMSGYPLFENHYEDVMAQCDSVFADGYHGLTQATGTNDGYREHFLNYIENTYSPQESLFEVSFSYLGELGLTVHGRLGGLNGVVFGYGGGQEGYPSAYAMYNASPVMDNIYDDPDDVRLAWNVASYQYTNGGDIKRVTGPLATQHCPAKYRRWEPLDWADLDITPASGTLEPYKILETASTLNRNFTSINFPVLRYSDVLLMYAEAANEHNGTPTVKALESLNQVRNRAGLANIETIAPVVATNHDLFFKEIVDERLRELCFEGVRKHDLIRWELLDDKLAETAAAIKASPDYNPGNEDQNAFLRASNNFDPSKHLSLPYPLQEVTINKLLAQKTGW
ncbi:RagB/SusD family nutrient uptake outer membrane protein [Reichenbachiella carrageenanivorans]|uniref:RagB/SusD family nutrient uptake outer membrane protein n=1 Tax=Reichenbachiella carrageenanivorans TaxID=2979869 RepID=A0ABY6D5B6_9BACT|nr:RagB/SusD family nutrient uptake outer membrane protein [Reichenbachiella carrageenanivorans]UXX81293.1 RagB/SusD family nutrient uptake outer membrane protein [Reichenbachiella carrageenanivorans]